MKNPFKPIGEWNAMFVGLALIPFIGLIFMIVTGECLNPYDSCVAGPFDYAVPTILTAILLFFAAKK